MSQTRAKIIRNGDDQVVQLPQGLGFPEGHTEVVVRREGSRLILEAIGNSPEDPQAWFGTWPGEETEAELLAALEALRRGQ